MKELKTVFENEEAAKLLNYFISYKEIINNYENENQTKIEVAVMPKRKILV